MNNVKNGSLVSRFFELLLYIPAILFMPAWELGKFLTKKAYGGGWVRGIMVGISGLPATAYGALFCANLFGWHYGLSWPLWSFAGALGAALTAGIVWPAFYLAILNPLWDLCDKIFDVNGKLAKNCVQPASSWAISAVRHLPYSENLWQISEGKIKAGRTWGMRALSGLLDLGALAIGLAAAYFVYHAGLALIPLFGALPFFSGVYLSQIVAGSFALTSLVLVTGFLAQYVAYGRDQKGREAFTAVAYSGIITFLTVTKIGFLAALSPVGLGAVSVLGFVVSLAYILPALIAALQGGLMNAVFKGWKKLLEAAYDAEEDKAYDLFFAQFANIVLALAEAAVAFFVADAVHLPIALTLALTAFVALCSYASNPRDLIGSRRVNPIFGMVIAVGSGLAAYPFSPASLAAHGFYHYALAIGSTFLVGLIVYPLAYLALRFVAMPVAPAVGPALTAVSTAATDSYGLVSK